MGADDPCGFPSGTTRRRSVMSALFGYKHHNRERRIMHCMRGDTSRAVRCPDVAPARRLVGAHRQTLGSDSRHSLEAPLGECDSD